MKTSWARLQTHSSVNRQRWGAWFIWPSGSRLCLHQLGLWGEEKGKKKRWEKRSMRGVTPDFFPWLSHKEIQGTRLYWSSLLGSCKWKGSFAKIRLWKNIRAKTWELLIWSVVWSKSERHGELRRMKHCSWSAETSWVQEHKKDQNLSIAHSWLATACLEFHRL